MNRYEQYLRSKPSRVGLIVPLEEVREGERFMYKKTAFPHMQARGPWALGKHNCRKDCIPIIDMGTSRSRTVSGGDFELRDAMMLIVEDAKS